MGLFAKLTGKSATSTATTKSPSPKPQYRGVEIVAGPHGCCGAVKAIRGQRYLPDEVPRLPLDACDADECGCSFELFDDRRTDLRRAADTGYDMVSQYRTDDNRRGVVTGRRDDD